MLAEERRRQVLEIVQNETSAKVSDLCLQFGVSEMTIRRDLRILEEKALIRRIHGGAVSAPGRSYEPPLLLRSSTHIEEKERIGRRAVEMINDGDSIALDIGSTTFEIAKRLQGYHNLSIVTASLPIINVLADQNDIRLIVAGGILRPGELSMVGHLTERALEEFHVDKAFIGIGAISLDSGLTEFNLEDAIVKRSLIAGAKHRIVVADWSKFGRTAFASVGPLSDIHTIITDDGMDQATLSSLQQIGLEVLLV